MIRREALPIVTSMLERHAAVAQLEPRQVGKATLALVIAKTMRAVYLDLGPLGTTEVVPSVIGLGTPIRRSR